MLRSIARKEPQIRALETPLSKWALAEITSCRTAEKDKKFARDAKGLEVLMAYLGKTIGGFNQAGLWEQIILKHNQIWASVPLLAAMLRSIQKEATKSKPLYAYRADFADVDAQEVARFGSTLIEYLTKKFFTPKAEQTSVLESIAFGFGAGEVVWDERAGEPTALIAVSCATCGTTGHVYAEAATEEVPCPNEQCGQPMTKAGKTVEIPAGDVVLHRVDPFSINSNTWAEDDDKPAIWWSIDDILDRALWECLHPDIDLPASMPAVALGEELLHLRRQRSFIRAQMGLESARAISRGRSEITSERDRLRMRDFFAPEVYRYKKTAAPETLPSGRVIPGNTALVEEFPDGMCVLRDSAARVVDIYPADPRRSIKIWNFSTKPGDRWGASTAAQALECQYLLEEDLSQLQTVASEMGNPTMFYAKGLFDGRLGQHPAGKQPVDMRLFGDMDLSKLIYHLPPGVPSPVIFQLVLFYEQRMQGVLSAWSVVGGGLPDAVGKTATGMVKASQEQESQQGMYLELRAQAKMEILQEGVRLFCKHADIRRALSMGGPFADGAVLQLDRSMLPEKFSLEVKKDSWWPRDRGQQQVAEMQRYQMLMLANQVSMLLNGRPLNGIEKRSINDLCGSEIGTNMAQIGAEQAVREWKLAKTFLTRARTEPTPEDKQALAAARAQLLAQAQAAAAEQQTLAAAQALGQPGAAEMLAAPPEIPEPPKDEIILAAADLVLPIRPGLTLCLTDVADQLRYEALKVENRELPDLFLEWLDRRAGQYDALAQSRKAAEIGAAGPLAAGPPGAGAEAPMNGTGNPVGDALLTRLAAISGGSAESLGLPGPEAVPTQAATGAQYGPS